MGNEPFDGAADLAKVRALGRMVQRKRISERLTLQQAAERSGVSAPTLSRLERLATTKSMTGPIPDTRTLTSVAHWLGVSLEEALEGGPKRPDINNLNIPQGGSTPEIVRAHLRADRNLDPTTAAMLAQMFELAYEQYSKLSGASANNAPDQDNRNQS
jgi:transcriptional regulator with XRE-family HTH domain